MARSNKRPTDEEIADALRATSGLITTRAFAPIVLPMISGLATLTGDELLDDDEEPTDESEE